MSGGGDAALRAILETCRVIALVGASPNPARPSYGVMQYLLGAGYRVIPVNPGQAGGSILGQDCYAALGDIPEPIDMVDIFRASDAVPAVVDAALALETRPKVIWMQIGVVNEAAAAKAKEAGLDVVMNRCTKIDHARLLA